MTLTKAGVVEQIKQGTGFTTTKAADTLETLLEIMKRTMAGGEDVLISGFGKFSVKAKPKRRGRNPATGKDLTLRKRRVVTFKCSGQLKKKIQNTP